MKTTNYWGPTFNGRILNIYIYIYRVFKRKKKLNMALEKLFLYLLDFVKCQIGSMF